MHGQISRLKPYWLKMPVKFQDLFDIWVKVNVWVRVPS